MKDLLKKLPLIIFSGVAVFLGLIVWTALRTPTIEDVRASTLIREKFMAAAGTNIVAEEKLRIIDHSGRRSTELIIIGKLSDEKKRIFRMITEAIAKEQNRKVSIEFRENSPNSIS